MLLQVKFKFFQTLFIVLICKFFKIFFHMMLGITCIDLKVYSNFAIIFNYAPKFKIILILRCVSCINHINAKLKKYIHLQFEKNVSFFFIYMYKTHIFFLLPAVLTLYMFKTQRKLFNTKGFEICFRYSTLAFC